MVFETLNRLRWTGGLDRCEITILHRGAPDDKKVISGSDVTNIKKSYFNYKCDKGETTIPLHRVLAIRSGGKVLWERNVSEG
jgi:uncharacterized protein (UPF0248 family)